MKKKPPLVNSDFNAGCVLFLALYQISCCLAFSQTNPTQLNDRDRGTDDSLLQLPPVEPISYKLFFEAQQAALNATPESLAALSNDDPLLAIIYLDHGLNHLEEGPHHAALVADMKRRGEVTVDILVQFFKKPNSLTTRSNILHGLRYLQPWLKPDRILILARAWHSQSKAWNSTDSLPLIRFLSWAGQPEDEALMRKLLGPEGQNTADMKDFLQHIEAIKKYRQAEQQKKAHVSEVTIAPSAKASGPSHPTVVVMPHENSSWNLTLAISGACVAVAALVAWGVGRKG